MSYVKQPLQYLQRSFLPCVQCLPLVFSVPGISRGLHCTPVLPYHALDPVYNLTRLCLDEFRRTVEAPVLVRQANARMGLITVQGDNSKP